MFEFVLSRSWQRAFVLMLFCIAATLSTVAQDETVKKLNNKGFDALENNKIEQAEKIFLSIIEKYEPNYKTHKGLGSVYQTIGDFPKAIAQFSKAIDLNSDDWHTYYNRGCCNIMARHFEKAESDLLIAISLNDSEPLIFNALGRVKHETGDFMLAFPYFQQSIKLDPLNVTYHNNMALMLITSGELDSAKSYLNVAWHLDRNNSQIYEVYSLLYLKENKRDSSIAYARKALELEKNHRNFYRLATVLSEKRISDESYDLLKQSLEYAGDQSEAMWLLGTYHVEHGQYSEAMKYYEQTLEKYPEFEDAVLNLAYCHMELGNLEKARDKFMWLVKRDPKNAFALNNLGFALYKLGELDEALLHIERSIQLMPENSYAWKNRGLVVLDTEGKEKACEYFHKAEALGFRDLYGSEVDDLIKRHCAQ